MKFNEIEYEFQVTLGLGPTSENHDFTIFAETDLEAFKKALSFIGKEYEFSDLIKIQIKGVI